MSRASKEMLAWLRLNVENDAALDWLLHAPDEFLECRSGHAWPKLRPGPLPKGLTYEPTPERDGCFVITYLCGRCGTDKTEITDEWGIFTADIYRKYNYPDGYSCPSGSNITPTLCKTELSRRFAEYQELKRK